MAGIPALPRKTFLVARGDGPVQHARLEVRWRETVPPGLIGKAEVDGVVPALVELTVGGESWLVELRALESVVESARDSQEYFAGVVD